MKRVLGSCLYNWNTHIFPPSYDETWVIIPTSQEILRIIDGYSTGSDVGTKFLVTRENDSNTLFETAKVISQHNVSSYKRVVMLLWLGSDASSTLDEQRKYVEFALQEIERLSQWEWGTYISKGIGLDPIHVQTRGTVIRTVWT